MSAQVTPFPPQLHLTLVAAAWRCDFIYIYIFLNPKNGSRLCFPEMTDLYLLQGKMTWRNVLQKTNVRFEFVTASWFFDTIFVYIYIYLFSCAVVSPKKRICWLSSTSWHPWNMQLVVLPFHFKGSSVLKYSIVFFLLLGRCPDSQPRHFFFNEPILERLRDSSRDSNGTVNSHQWGTSLGSKLNHSEIDSQRNSKEDS